MVSRREWIGLTLSAGAALTLDARGLLAQAQRRVIMRAIPSTGEQIPAVGLGTAFSFSRTAGADDRAPLRDVVKTLADLGGKLIDTAPGYGASEEVVGALAAELGLTNKIFWATKVNEQRTNTRAAIMASIDRSFQRLKVQKIDLMQVHNMADPSTHLPVLKDLKQQGRIRYIGVTTTSNRQYPALEEVMKTEPLDFIQIDYSIDNRDVEERILPLAMERKIGVLTALPYGRQSVFAKVRDKPLPDWAKDIDATSFGQIFLKYLIGNPAVTAVIPGTHQAEHMRDNFGAAVGRLPDEAMRKRMVEWFGSLTA